MRSDHGYSLSPWRPIKLDDLVRLGRSEDGGYLVPRRCIEATRVVVGMGIFDDWSFEAAFAAANPSVAIVGVDGTVSDRQFRSRMGEAKMRALIALVRFHRSQAADQLRIARHWSAKRRELVTFFDGARRRLLSKHVADVESQWETTWPALSRNDDLIADAGPLGIFVKMDIEGSEYRVLVDVLADHERINGLVIEFHDVDVHWGRFAELLDASGEHFAVAHVHGNNYHPLIRGAKTPRALEITLVNRGLLAAPVASSDARYPLVGLDRPCDPTRPDYALEF
jgi:hypothetical protein